ncbi:hypothetical protein HH214_09100 [Mucilaginibacter robiniae]|uniref:Uncharacterized protein n=1 Tax=Mucilaginibacter robiniae TaxID=2728022 RepID=A0A7L5DY25_9SPHI|nr:hypothetical protein [Mucilaginibacter robiniae]QJD96022.1 hypothetical protein HH214_09100 [Mucilaginibacter robiniae]
MDLVTHNSLYGTSDYPVIETGLQQAFPYLSGDFGANPVNGKSSFIGKPDCNHAVFGLCSLP